MLTPAQNFWPRCGVSSKFFTSNTTASRGPSAETHRCHPASRGPSTETPRRHLASRGHSIVTSRQMSGGRPLGTKVLIWRSKCQGGGRRPGGMMRRFIKILYKYNTTASRGPSAETPRRHPASRGHSVVTPRQMSEGRRPGGKSPIYGGI